MAVFSLHVLGDPVLRGRDGPVRGRAAYKRRLALLAILAAARGRPVGRERIIGLLWPEQSSDSARHTLSESLYVLRKDLGEEAFVSLGDEVALNPGCVESDVGGFQEAVEAGRLEEAVRLYGGPFLDGFYVADAPEFERWAEGERDRLARAYAGVVEKLAEAAEADADALRAAEWWRRLAVHDPYSSRVALRLMRALEAAGERAAALRFADAHAALLREELGVDPDDEVLDFGERLRAEPPRRPAPPPAPRPGEAAAAVAAALREPSPVAEETEEAEETVVAAPEVPPAAADAAETPAALVEASGDASAEARPAAASSPAEAVPAAAPRGSGGRRRSVALPAAALYAGGVAALVLLVALLASATRGREGGEPAPPRHDPRRIAVLYFDDHSPGGELEYLANGLTEMLIHELSQVQALDVISRNGVKPYREGTVPFDSMVADLRVGSIVEGSLQRSGGRVQVTVQLIDANTQAHLESRLVVRPMGDVLALEHALAEEVSGFLRRRLGQEVRLLQAGAGTRSARARELVLQAEQLRDQAARLAGREHPQDAPARLRLLLRADSLLARAEDADPRWTHPTVLRGWVGLSRAAVTPGPPATAVIDTVLARAGGVLAREPDNPRALELRGYALWARGPDPRGGAHEAARLERGERDLRAAVAAEPGLATAWRALSQLLLSRGQFAEADLAARRALAEDAYLEEADEVLRRLFFGALMLGDYRAAADVCDRGRRMFPADWGFVECRLTLLREDPSQPADPALAWALVAELDRLDPAPRARADGRAYAPVYRRMVAASVLARAGEKDSARAVVARARRDAADDAEARVAVLYDEAHVRLLLGERDAARRALDAYLAARPQLRPFIARDPLFRELAAPR